MGGALPISRNVVSMHQTYDLDCFLYINTCEGRARTMAVGGVFCRSGNQKAWLHERILGMTT